MDVASGLCVQVAEINAMVVDLLGIELPSKAYYGQRGELLSSLTRGNVVDACDLWIATCGADYSKW